MANPVLFASSLFFAFLHLALILYFQPPLAFSYCILCGVFSSVWNHGTTSDVAKWSDRGMMAVGAIVDSAYIAAVPTASRLLLASLIVAAIVGYAGAKALVRVSKKKEASPAASVFAAVFTSGNLPHLLAHLCLSCTHFIMIAELPAQCAQRKAQSGGGLAGLLCVRGH